NTLALTRDGRRAVTCSNDTTLIVWDLAGGQELHRLEGHTEHVWGLALSPDGRLALSGGGGQRRGDQWLAGVAIALRVWDPEKGTERRRFARGHTGPISSVDISPDGRRAISGGADATVRLWDVTTGTELNCFWGERGAGIRGLAFMPDNRRAL